MNRNIIQILDKVDRIESHLRSGVTTCSKRVETPPSCKNVIVYFINYFLQNLKKAILK